MTTCSKCPQPIANADSGLCYYHAKQADGVFEQEFVGQKTCVEEGCTSRARDKDTMCSKHRLQRYVANPEHAKKRKEYMKTYRARKRQENPAHFAATIKKHREHWRDNPIPPDHPKHGTAHGYNYYQCRCRPCTDAHNAAHKAWLERKKERESAS